MSDEHVEGVLRNVMRGKWESYKPSLRQAREGEAKTLSCERKRTGGEKEKEEEDGAPSFSCVEEGSDSIFKNKRGKRKERRSKRE